MISAGFASDMINLSRSNRNALKEGCIYKNFDREYITFSMVSRKAPVFRKVSPEYLREIRQKLKEENQRIDRIRLRLFIASAGIAGILLSLFFL